VLLFEIFKYLLIIFNIINYVNSDG